MIKTLNIEGEKSVVLSGGERRQHLTATLVNAFSLKKLNIGEEIVGNTFKTGTNDIFEHNPNNLDKIQRAYIIVEDKYLHSESQVDKDHKKAIKDLLVKRISELAKGNPSINITLVVSPNQTEKIDFANGFVTNVIGYEDFLKKINPQKIDTEEIKNSGFIKVQIFPNEESQKYNFKNEKIKVVDQNPNVLIIRVPFTSSTGSGEIDKTKIDLLMNDVFKKYPKVFKIIDCGIYYKEVVRYLSDKYPGLHYQNEFLGIKVTLLNIVTKSNQS